MMKLKDKDIQSPMAGLPTSLCFAMLVAPVIPRLDRGIRKIIILESAP